MGRILRSVAVLLCVVSAGPARSLWAKDDPMTDDEVVVKTDEGHHLLIPKDWPVEHAHGTIAPVPIEQYLSMKFDQVRDRFAQTDTRLDALGHRLDQLERDNTVLQKRLRLLETREQVRPQPKEKEGTHGHPSEGS